MASTQGKLFLASTIKKINTLNKHYSPLWLMTKFIYCIVFMILLRLDIVWLLRLLELLEHDVRHFTIQVSPIFLKLEECLTV